MSRTEDDVIMTCAAGLGRGFVIGARSFQFLGERWKEVLL